ncbi:MAG: GTPase [Bacillota bacterium]
MKEALVIGRPNVGKTLFTVNFAEHLGQKRLAVMFRPRDGATYTRVYSIAGARADLVGEGLHRTLGLQSVVLRVPKGKSVRRVVLTDSTGLIDDVHPSSVVRRAMADTIRAVSEADLILHLVDPVEGVTGVDLDILRYGKTHDGYAVLANKVDLPGRADRVAELSRLATPSPVFPVSALRGTGFREVRGFVRRCL